MTQHTSPAPCAHATTVTCHSASKSGGGQSPTPSPASAKTRCCCAYVRTEEGRAIRKVVGDRENFRHRCLEPRTDGCSNVLSTVLKDNPILEYMTMKDEYEYTEFELTEDTKIEPLGDCRFRFTKPDGETRTLRFDIRKLTETECFRLMNVDDSDIKKIKESGISRSQMYKLAGNSIVCSVLVEIFRKLLIDTEKEYTSGEQMTLF